MTKLSILICALESRKHLLDEMVADLNKQIQFLRPIGKVEILVNLDNKQKTTGKKRQELLDQSKGEYIVFADEDDYLYPYYVEEMLRGCASGCDCLAINGIYTSDGMNETRWELSKDNENENVTTLEGKPLFLRRTNHITAVRRELALAAGFPDYSNGEDKYYSERLHLTTEFKIERPLYHYRFSTQNKEY